MIWNERGRITLWVKKTFFMSLFFTVDILECDLYLAYEKLELLVRATSHQQQSTHTHARSHSHTHIHTLAKYHRLCVWINYEGPDKGSSLIVILPEEERNAISDLEHMGTV